MSSGLDNIKGTVLTFDFVIEELKTFYSPVSPQNAYREIKMYLLQFGFEHLKDSDYKHPELSMEQSLSIIREYAKNNKWFAPCLKKLNLSPNIPVLDVSGELKLMYCDEDWLNSKRDSLIDTKDEAEELEL